jgi:lipopolysaccharide export system protein LptA
MIAKGDPVRIRQKGGQQQQDIEAECRMFNYDIDKKISRLEGKPVIYNRKAGKTSKVMGDLITITRDENNKTSVNIESSKGSNQLSEFSVVDTKTSGTQQKANPGGKTAQPPKKVDKNLDIIKLPQIE